VEEKKVRIRNAEGESIGMEGGMFHVLTNLIETMNYVRRDRVLPKDHMIMGIVTPESKSYLTWKPTGWQE
jgi:hypothetical protein